MCYQPVYGAVAASRKTTSLGSPRRVHSILLQNAPLLPGLCSQILCKVTHASAATALRKIATNKQNLAQKHQTNSKFILSPHLSISVPRQQRFSLVPDLLFYILLNWRHCFAIKLSQSVSSSGLRTMQAAET